VCIAGQIALEAGTMALLDAPPLQQLQLALLNAARVCACLDTCLPHALHVLVYVATPIMSMEGLAEIRKEATAWVRGERGTPSLYIYGDACSAMDSDDDDSVGRKGAIDAIQPDKVYFDLGKYAHLAPPQGAALDPSPVVHIITVPALPRGAAVEVEVVAAKSVIASTGLKATHTIQPHGTLGVVGIPGRCLSLWWSQAPTHVASQENMPSIVIRSTENLLIALLKQGVSAAYHTHVRMYVHVDVCGASFPHEAALDGLRGWFESAENELRAIYTNITFSVIPVDCIPDADITALPSSAAV
jgi:enamine deaminase RidA (YjgF/YER057c/UK114 family)